MNQGLPGDDVRPEGAISVASLAEGTRKLGRGVKERPGPFIWTPENVRRLIELSANKTVPEIAQIMGTSKNSIVGKAHRLGISFPKFRDDCATGHREITDMLAAGMWPSEIAIALGQHVNTIHGKIKYMRRRDGEMKAPPRLDDLGPDQCRWPLGDPKQRAEAFCGEPIVPDKPYCAEHCAKAYLKPSKEKGEPVHFERKRNLQQPGAA